MDDMTLGFLLGAGGSSVFWVVEVLILMCQLARTRAQRDDARREAARHRSNAAMWESQLAEHRAQHVRDRLAHQGGSVA